MKTLRTKHSPAFKAKVALEALKEQKASGELAGHYQVHPTQIRHCKNMVSQSLINTFTGRRQKREQDKDLLTEIFKLDHGSQFTILGFIGKLKQYPIRISMDGRGWAMDSIFTERLWRSLKYEEAYHKDYVTVAQARQGIRAYFRFYNEDRRHQSLAYRPPAEVYGAR